MPTWKLYAQMLWVALRRSRTDPRARKAIQPFIHTIWALAYPMVLIVVYGGWEWALPIASLYGLLFFFMYRIGRPVMNDPQTSPTVVSYLKERALILTSFFIRGTGELSVHQHPDKRDVAEQVRRAQNEFLRRRALWEKLSSQEYELASAAAGSWGANPAPLWAEQLRVLRWVLKVDDELAPLAFFRQYEIPQVNDTRGIDSATNTRPAWDIQDLHYEAAVYVNRISQEKKNRGMIPADAAIGDFPNMGGESKDLLVGIKTVGALTNEELVALGFMAFARYQYSNYLIEQVAADQPIPFA